MLAARFFFEYRAMYKKEFDLQSDGFTSEVELMTDIQDIANATLPREKEDFVLTVSSG